MDFRIIEKMIDDAMRHVDPNPRRTRREVFAIKAGLRSNMETSIKIRRKHERRRRSLERQGQRSQDA